MSYIRVPRAEMREAALERRDLDIREAEIEIGKTLLEQAKAIFQRIALREPENRDADALVDFIGNIIHDHIDGGMLAAIDEQREVLACEPEARQWLADYRAGVL